MKRRKGNAENDIAAKNFIWHICGQMCIFAPFIQYNS